MLEGWDQSLSISLSVLGSPDNIYGVATLWPGVVLSTLHAFPYLLLEPVKEVLLFSFYKKIRLTKNIPSLCPPSLILFTAGHPNLARPCYWKNS